LILHIIERVQKSLQKVRLLPFREIAPPTKKSLFFPCCKRNVSIIMCLVEFFFNGSKIPELQKFAIKILSDKVSVVSACERERERERDRERNWSMFDFHP